jgi:hypothetical protein
VCARSYLYHGYEFHLYTYGDVDGIPEGVTVKDAGEIIPHDIKDQKAGAWLEGDRSRTAKAHIYELCDLFRYELIYKYGGWWVDMDAVCLKPYMEDEYIFASESSTVCNGIFKCPAHSDVMQYCISQAKNTEVKKFGDIGPKLIDSAIKACGLTEFVRRRREFTPIPGPYFKRLFRPGMIHKLGKACGVHLFASKWTKEMKEGTYDQTSIWEHLKKKYL